jgi:hypothetical protein
MGCVAAVAVLRAAPKGAPQRMPSDWNQGLYFVLGLLLAFYFLAPFLELGLD